MNALLDWFRDSGFANLLSFGVAFPAVLISIGAIVVSRRANARSHATQERLVRIEEQRESDRRTQATRAALRARMAKNERGSWRLYIRNDGMAEARKVDIRMDGKALLEHPTLAANQRVADRIGPGGEVSYLMRIHLSSKPPPYKLEITWEDDSGEPGRYRTSLTF